MKKEIVPSFLSLLKYETEIDIPAITQTIEERLKPIPVYGDILTFIEKRSNIIEMNGIKRSIERLDELASKLLLENKLDRNYIENNKREIYFNFKFFLNSVYNQPNEEFIDYLTQYISNCINEDFSDLKIKSTILNKIAKYTKQHIEILEYIFRDSKLHGWPDKIKNDDYNFQSQIDGIRNIDTAIIKFCVHDLLNDGFIFQSVGMFSGNTYSPYEITEIGVQCLKMVGVNAE